MRLPKLRHPIVLVHGLGAKARYGPFSYFHGLETKLRESGNTVLIPEIHPLHRLEVRAGELETELLRAFPDPTQRLNLIGHSFGGIDARVLASRPAFRGRIASVTTIGTPNHGSTLCDLAARRVPESANRALDAFLQIFSFSIEVYEQLTTAYCREVLNRTVAPREAGVAYFSVATAIIKPVYKHSLPLFWLPHAYLERTEGPNDGFVSERSAQWGTHLGTYPGDHYSQIGQFLGRTRGLDLNRFHSDIFGRLHAEGF